MDKLILIFISFLLLVGIVIGSIIGFRFLVLKESEIKNEARFQCAQSSKYQVVDGDTTISYPPKDLYEECLDEKGI